MFIRASQKNTQSMMATADKWKSIGFILIVVGMSIVMSGASIIGGGVAIAGIGALLVGRLKQRQLRKSV